MGVLLLFSCNNSKRSHSEKIQGEIEINLNNGAKWLVNSEMKPHIKKEEALLVEYRLQKDQDYQKLAKNLKTQNNALIKSCTMKGESHDALHKWLYPHIELIENLTKAENAEEASKIVFKLQKSFTLYNNTFR